MMMPEDYYGVVPFWWPLAPKDLQPEGLWGRPPAPAHLM